MDVMEAVDKLREATEFANPSPDMANRDFILVDKDRTDENLESPYRVRELPLHRELLDSLTREFINFLQGTIQKVETDKLDIVQYSVENGNKDKVPLQYLDESDVPKMSRFREIIQNRDYPDATIEEELPSFQAYRIKSTGLTIDKRLIGFRRYTNRQIIGSSFSLKGILDGTEYNKFEDKLFALPDEFDAVYYDGTIFVFKPSNFELVFDYLDAYQESADQVFDFLRSSKLTISNLSRVEDAIKGDHRSLRTMRKIEKRGLYKDLKPDDAQQIVDEYDLDLEVEKGENGRWTIEISDMRKKFHILHLLNDDHLESRFTQNKYQVSGKDQRS
jgi:hypothetical protein